MLILRSGLRRDHPLRAVRDLVEQVLVGLSREFAKLYSHTGRPSIPPEQLSEGHAVAGVLHDPVRAAADGADRLQPAVPLVCRACDG